jgi:hypothetical protein
VRQAGVVDPTLLPPPGEVATWSSEPLVVAARVEQPDDAPPVLARLRAEHPGHAFVTVVAPADAGRLGDVLDGLEPVLAERVFAGLDPGSGVTGHDLAGAALDEHGVGQDFVFEVATVDDAVSLGLGALAPDRDLPWDGTGLLVAGPLELLRQAGAALASAAPPAAP